jgi:hypothetical protein
MARVLIVRSDVSAVTALLEHRVQSQRFSRCGPIQARDNPFYMWRDELGSQMANSIYRLKNPNLHKGAYLINCVIYLII